MPAEERVGSPVEGFAIAWSQEPEGPGMRGNQLAGHWELMSPASGMKQRLYISQTISQVFPFKYIVACQNAWLSSKLLPDQDDELITGLYIVACQAHPALVIFAYVVSRWVVLMSNCPVTAFAVVKIFL